MYYRKQLEDVRLVVPLRRRQLVALVRHWGLMALVVLLSQDRSYGDVEFIVRTARRAGSKVHNTGAKERASFSASKLALNLT